MYLIVHGHGAQTKPYQTVIQHKYLIIAAGSLLLVHNAGHSTIITDTGLFDLLVC